MITNRSVPPATVIPVLVYDDIERAADWLCDVFGFRERLRIGDHRSQLVFGDGAIVAADRSPGSPDKAEAPSEQMDTRHSLLVRVEDANQHYEHAKGLGARILSPPVDQPFGERQYSVEDIGGHRWTFTQSIADVHPNEWGGADVVYKEDE